MTVPFGKYKGKSLEYVYNNDLQYFKWLESVAVKEPLVSRIANFRLHLQEVENKLIYDTLCKIDKYIDQRKIVYQVNVHNVGEEYRLEDISIEEIVGNHYTLRIKRKSYLLRKDSYEVLKEVLYSYWVKTGKNTKDRGLY